jgi:cyclopropane fatty-acyl-phospholipid synthase-like methyltransferase
VVSDGPRLRYYRRFLDQGQYSSSFDQYNEVFGVGYASIGGAALTASLLARLQLAPGQRVLDVGSGPGGESAWHRDHQP